MLSRKSVSKSFVLLFLNISLISQCSIPFLDKEKFHYRLGTPDKKYELQNKISEISGLNMISSHEVAVVEDENGIIFYYDLEKNRIVKRKPFGKDGDYEDLHVFGDSAYIIRSDGTLFEILNLENREKSIEKQKYTTALTGKNNTEGLCYDKRNNRLLIACKGKAGISGDEKYKHTKAIYSFSLVTKTLSDVPVYLIDDREVEKIADNKKTYIIDKLLRLYNIMPKSSFEPSGISINPINNDIYIIASVGKILVVLGEDGKLKEVLRLPRNIFKQPEGICFDPEGNLYISNEGRSGKGNILKFNYEK